MKRVGHVSCFVWGLLSLLRRLVRHCPPALVPGGISGITNKHPAQPEEALPNEHHNHPGQTSTAT